jgi:hypothetical protein
MNSVEKHVLFRKLPEDVGVELVPRPDMLRKSCVSDEYLVIRSYNDCSYSICHVRLSSFNQRPGREAVATHDSQYINESLQLIKVMV